MSLEKIKLTDQDYIITDNNNPSGVGCGRINQDSCLYLIDKAKMEALRLPEKYKAAAYYDDGGGLIMVSLLPKRLRFQYYDDFEWAAGLWGWMDMDGNEVIPPQYPYAYLSWNGKAVVCKGTWSVDDFGNYGCKNGQWGVIDLQNRTVVPFQYDEISEILFSEQFLFCHKGGWPDGRCCIIDIETGQEIFELDENIPAESYVSFKNGCLFFEYFEGDGDISFLDVYRIEDKKQLVHHALLEDDDIIFGEATEFTINEDGKDITVHL